MIVKLLRDAVFSRQLNINELISCVLVIGAVCDRSHGAILDESTILVANEAISEAEAIDAISVVSFPNCEKAIAITRKLIDGVILAEDEEEYLLERLKSE